MKYLLFLAFVLSVVVCDVNAQSHNVTYGVVGRFDRILHRQFAVQKSRWLQTVSEDFRYPPKGMYGQLNITAIQIYDLYRNGTGGYARVINGGPGYNYTTIYMKSQRGHGYSFIIDIYTR